jgi:hypothetical protein
VSAGANVPGSGAGSGGAAPGDTDPGALQKASNLSDVANVDTSRDNLKAPSWLVPTSVKTGPYTAASGDFVPVDTTSGSVTITLPTAPRDKSRIAIKHVIQGGTNTVTFACGGSDVFNKTGGATTGTLTLLSQSVLLQYSSSGAIWYVQADDLPLSQLDSRYDATGAASAAQAAAVQRANHTGTQAESTVTNLVSDLAAKLAAASNLSDVANASTARDNINGAKVVGSVTADVTVVSTASETDLQTLTLPANPVAGDLYTVRFAGTALNNVGSNQNFTFKFYLGSTAYLASAAVAASTSASNHQWTAEVNILITDSTHQEIWGTFYFGAAVAAGVWTSGGPVALSLMGWAQGTENTSTSKTVKLTATLTSAGGQQSVTGSVGVLTVIRA